MPGPRVYEGVLVPEPVLTTDRCIECEHSISAVTVAALDAMRQAHTDYVNTQLPRISDPHFTESRLERLCKR